MFQYSRVFHFLTLLFLYLLPEILVDFPCFCYFSEPFVALFSMGLAFRTSSIVDTIHSRGRSSWLLAALINSLHTIFLLNYFKITRKTRINSRKLGQKLLGVRHFDILCTFAVMWHAINQNKEFVLWSLPAFITSLPLLTLVKLTWEICLGFIGHCKCPVDWFEHLNKDQLMDE